MCDVCDAEEERMDEELLNELAVMDAEAGEDAAGPEPTYEEWVAGNLGPRRVGGRYRNHYWNQAYTVVAIEPGPREGWPVWQITVLNDGDDEPVSHCTAWDERDEVLSEPDAEVAR
jgi:hypothetical protein